MTEPVLAITPGEPAGIGPEILLKLCHDHPDFRILAVADPGLLEQAAKRLGYAMRIERWQPGDMVQRGGLVCCPVALQRPARPGCLDPANAAYVLETLKRAVELLRHGHAAALVADRGSQPAWRRHSAESSAAPASADPASSESSLPAR